jgi:type IV pilus assembly protein PilA
MFCRQCGTTNPDAAQYCSKCGTTFAATHAASAAPAPGPAPIAPTHVPTSGKAIASLICGIFTMFFPVGIAAIILGHLSLSDIRKSAGRLGGRGIAIAGLVLGYAGIALIALILIIAAFAIPNLFRGNIAQNEASAVGALRIINVAAVTYQSEYENGFPSSLDVLGGDRRAAATCNHANLLDRSLAEGRKFGYGFTYTPKYPDGSTEPVISPKAAAKGCTSGGASGYSITADPLQRGSTGRRSFYTDQTGVIRYANDGESATADSPPLE